MFSFFLSFFLFGDFLLSSPGLVTHFIFRQSNQMAEDIRLCSRCRSIDFKSLLYDRPGDIPEYALPHPDGVDGLWWTDEDQIPHGLLAAAVRRRSSCDFCAFISESACHGFKRDLDGDADSDTDSDTDTDENDSNAETTSGGCSPESTALSVSEVEINMSDTRMRFLGKTIRLQSRVPAYGYIFTRHRGADAGDTHTHKQVPAATRRTLLATRSLRLVLSSRCLTSAAGHSSFPCDTMGDPFGAF